MEILVCTLVLSIDQMFVTFVGTADGEVRKALGTYFDVETGRFTKDGELYVHMALGILSNLGYGERSDMPASPGETGGMITLIRPILPENPLGAPYEGPYDS